MKLIVPAGVLLLAAAVPMSLAAAAGPAPAPAPAGHPDPVAHRAAAGWTQVWGAAMQRPTPGTADNGPNWSTHGFADVTLRQVVRLSAGGPRLRLRLSNVYGTRPLRIAGVRIGRTAQGATVWPDGQRAATLRHNRHWVIPAGREAVSDPVALPTEPLQKVTISLRLSAPTGPATFHRFTTTTAYRATGDHLSDVDGRAFTARTSASYYLTGVETIGQTVGSVVTLGDSGTDGVGSSADADARYPDDLAELAVAAGKPYAVVNAGIAGGRLLHDTRCFGPSALHRLERDVLRRPGVRAVIVELGLNDLGASDDRCAGPAGQADAAELIAGLRHVAAVAHAHRLRVVGATLIPTKGALFPFYSERGERARRAVNRWIRSSGAFDAVADFDRVMADPADPRRSRPGDVYLDGLHPNDAGYHRLAAEAARALGRAD